MCRVTNKLKSVATIRDTAQGHGETATITAPPITLGQIDAGVPPDQGSAAPNRVKYKCTSLANRRRGAFLQAPRPRARVRSAIGRLESVAKPVGRPEAGLAAEASVREAPTEKIARPRDSSGM